jgi:hypothetical protein
VSANETPIPDFGMLARTLIGTFSASQHSLHILSNTEADLFSFFLDKKNIFNFIPDMGGLK